MDLLAAPFLFYLWIFKLDGQTRGVTVFEFVRSILSTLPIIVLTGVPLLCCRGSHRKLEKAKWNARASQGLFEQTIHDISQTESLITSTLDDGDAHTSSMTTSSQV